MKKLKKLLSIVLAVAMVLSLVVVTSAEDSTGYTITIKDSTEGYTYAAYQIFKGDYDATSGVLSNIKWGSNIDTDKISDLYTALAAIQDGDGKYPFTSENSSTGAALTSAADVAAALSECEDDSVVAQQFAKVIKNYITGDGTSTGTYDDDDSESYKIEGLEAGYYLVENTAVPTTDGAYTGYLLSVVGDSEVTTKKDVPSLDKTVDEKNDSDGTDVTSATDTADYDIGDSIKYALVASLPSNYSSYTSYALTFHDDLSAGLSYNNDARVYVYTAYTYNESTFTSFDNKTYYEYKDGVFTVTKDEAPQDGKTYYTKTQILKGYSVLTSQEDGCELEVKIDDTNKLDTTDGSNSYITVTDSSLIVVEYSATLTGESVVIGNGGNTNSAYITYSNNPNGTGTGTSTTDVTTVFTYKLEVTKTGENGITVLPGAGFTLYKLVEFTGTEFDGNTTYYTLSSSVYTKTSDNAPSKDMTYYYFAKVGNELGKDENNDYTLTNFTWSGLDDGIYMLEETTTPSGYNTIEDKYFSISATHGESTDGTTSLSALNIYEVEVESSSTGETLTVTDKELSETSEGSTPEYTTSTNDGTIKTTITNNKGSELPSTGGIGVTIFYVVGGILVLAAAGVIVISRKKTKAEK